MTSNALPTQGVAFYWLDTSVSPDNWEKVGDITGFQGPGGQATVIDKSNLDSTFREKMIGLPDEGQFTLDMNLDPSDDDGQMALRGFRAARSRQQFKLVLTDESPATELTWFGYVLNFSVAGQIDDKITAQATIEIDGAVSWSNDTP